MIDAGTCSEGIVRIWDSATGLEVSVLAGHTEEVYSAAYSPDGKSIVTASADQTVRIWDAATGKELRSLNHTQSVRSASYSPDGKTIVTASADGIARIWDVATWKEVRQLTGHTKPLWSASYSPGGRYIATSSEDQSARIWIASIDDLLAEAARLIQRDPPLLTPEERRRYGLE